jgi:3-deoxy-D-manno-octulosonate 8-phosphate phosphatase (KDO 8-P phosphatase)
MKDILDKAKKIQLVIFDVDGVMTDGSLFMGDDGQEYKAFNSLDGHGMRMLQEGGITAAIITGRKSNVVEHRMKDQGVTRVYQGYRDKIPAYEALMGDIGLETDQVAYVGDDVVDLPIMTRVGFAIAVQDAHPYVKKHAHWITQNNGGQGAVRDVCELILEARGLLTQTLESYLYVPK